MPKKPACDTDDVIKVIIASKNDIVIGKEIAFPSKNIWKNLSQQLDKKISPKGLYTLVKTNRHNLWTILGMHKSDNDNIEASTDCPISAESSDSSVDNYSTDGSLSSSDLKFDVTLTYQRWQQIWPEKVVYCDTSVKSQKREYNVLKRGMWTHALHEAIWKSTKLSCTLKFRRAKVYPNINSIFIDITGKCIECSAQLSIKIHDLPEADKPVVLCCVLSSVDESLHTGTAKRKLSGEIRKQVAKELWEGRKPAHVWRATKAYELMDVGDLEPSHLPNLATLRKAKQEMGDEELGDKDPIMSLQMLKYSVPHNGSIYDIGLDRFYCHYWTASQMQVYKTKSKQANTVVSFDATGTVVKKLKRPCGTSGHIFLYQGVLCSQGDHIPVVQMLSENHTTSSIANWLTEWQRAGAPVPKEAVSDFSLALLGALVKAFTSYPHLKTYVSDCFKILTKSNLTVPPCFIRIDVAHCIKLISRWECLRQKGNRVREFYLRAMAQLLQCESLDDAKELIFSVAVVALSESEGNDGEGIPVISETCKAKIKTRIAKGSLPIVPDDEQNQEETTHVETLNTDMKTWVADICAHSQMCAVHHGDRDNLHFLPDLVPNVIRLASYLPLWTSVMVPHFRSVQKTASSANVEAEFKNIKHGLFKNASLPMRVDRFVLHHLEFLEGSMRLCSVPKTVLTAEREQTESTRQNPSLTDIEENPVENWKGLILPHKKRPSYLNPCPEWLHADTQLKAKRTKINLLKNGNFQAKLAIKVDKKLVSVINTCAFDSFCQSLCSAVCDSTSFADHLQQEHVNNDMLDLVKTIITKGVGKDVYAKRAKMLLNTFECVTLKSGVLQIDANCNVYNIISKTMKEVPSASIFSKCSSPFCSRSTESSRSVPIVPINVEIVQSKGLKNLKEAVEDGLQLNTSTCLKPLGSPEDCPEDLKVTNDTNKIVCCGSVTHTFTTGQLLCLEMNDTTHSLSEIPVNMDLNSHLFTLRSVVAFIPGTTWQSIGHYVTYCRRTAVGWEKYDDLSDRVTTVSAKTIIQPHVIVFTREN